MRTSSLVLAAVVLGLIGLTSGTQAQQTTGTAPPAQPLFGVSYPKPGLEGYTISAASLGLTDPLPNITLIDPATGRPYADAKKDADADAKKKAGQAAFEGGPRQGSKEIAVSGSIDQIGRGTANGSIELSGGYFFTDAFEVFASFGFTGFFNDGPTDSTVGLGARYHFGRSRERPYVQAGIALNLPSFGPVFGGFLVGGGVDFFVKPQQSFFAELDYNSNVGGGNDDLYLLFGLRLFIR